MTDTSEKVRGLFLAALMVFSVFAGTVAFSGAAAAAANNYQITSAVEYNSGNVEIVLNESVDSVDKVTVDVKDGKSKEVSTPTTYNSDRTIVVDVSGTFNDINRLW